MNRVLEISKGRAAVTLKSMPKAGPGFVVVKQHLAPNCIENRIFDSGFFEFHESSDPSCYSEDNAHAIAGWCSHAGHEGVGEIVEIGPEVNGWAVGDRVVIFQGWPCGECWVCENELSPTHCMHLRVPADIEAFNHSTSGGNGFCEYRLAPATMLEKIPDDLSYRHAASANCLIGCTFSPVRDLDIGSEHVCLVGGVGFVGLATIINLKHRGAKVVVLGRDPLRMRAAMALFDADAVVNPEDDDWLEQVKALTPSGQGIDFAFECSGYPYYQQRCLDSLRHYGHLVLLGYAAHEGQGLTWPLNTESGLSWGHKVISSHFDVNVCHRGEILQTLRDPWIQQQVDKLVTHTFPMSEAQQAFELLQHRKDQSDFIGKIHFLPGQ